jgi:ribosomal protein S18 acetylase RimI-like enzyme
MIRRASVAQQTTAQFDSNSPTASRFEATGVKRACLAASSSDDGLAHRKLRLLKRSGLFGDNTKGCTIERACTLDDLRQAYRLVHDVYLETGFIRPEPSGMRLRMFETTSETATFVAKAEGRVVGVLSVVLDSPDLGLPSDAVFKPELDALRRTGARLSEVTNQAVADDYRKSAVPTELMRCAIALLMKAGYHEAVASVSPSHNGFYDLLGFRQVGSERSYSDKLHDPVIALSLNINQYREPRNELSTTERFMHEFLTETNHFMTRVGDWTREAKRQFLDPELLRQLFLHDGGFLTACSPEELRILYRRWGHEIFEAVAGERLGAKIAAINQELPWTPVETKTTSASPTPTASRPSKAARGASRRELVRAFVNAWFRPVADFALAANRSAKLLLEVASQINGRMRIPRRDGDCGTGREWAVEGSRSL